MDETLKSILTDLGIDSGKCPENEVKLLNQSQIISLGGRATDWGKSIRNHPCLAYRVDSEFDSPVGLALRNLVKGEGKSSILVYKGEGPFWHNLSKTLEVFYKTNLAVLVEGPKDARVLWNKDIPAAAYLGSSPSYKQLLTISHYVDNILWIPDNDPPSRERDKRISETYKNCSKLNLKLIEYSLEVKDPAELAFSESEFQRLEKRYLELKGFLR
jgi:hypothetical protein